MSNSTSSDVTIWSIDNCTRPETIKNEGYFVAVYGYVSIIVGLMTLVTNGFVCLVLLQKNMRTPTNLLLVAMAVADTLTGVFPIPTFFYLYTLGNYRDPLSYSLCLLNTPMTVHLPTVTHTASIWLTVALAAQRYIYVCHPQSAKSLCTVNNAITSIIAIYIAAAISQTSRFFEYLHYPIEVEMMIERNLNDSVRTMSSGPGGDGLVGHTLSDIHYDTETIVCCYRKLAPVIERNQQLYFGVYWWFRVVFIHLVPCVLLVILNALLFNAMRTAKARRDVLLRQNRRTESHRLAESNLATLMLVVVVTIFLLVEFPLMILVITMIYENTFEPQEKFLEPEERNVASLFTNLCILLSYPANFFIYCGMSRQFRKTFRSLFLCGGASARDGETSARHHHRESNCNSMDFQMTRLSVAP